MVRQAPPAASLTAVPPRTVLSATTRQQPVCVPVTRTREVQEQGASDGTIKSANLGWGVRDSFRNYVRGGIANG